MNRPISYFFLSTRNFSIFDARTGRDPRAPNTIEACLIESEESISNLKAALASEYALRGRIAER